MNKQVILTQLARFARLAGTAFVASGIVPQIVSGSTNRAAVVAAAVGAVEVAYRAIRPTLPKAHVDRLTHNAVAEFIIHAITHKLADEKAAASAVSAVEGAGTASAGALPVPAPEPPIPASQPAAEAPAPTTVVVNPPATVDVTSVPPPAAPAAPATAPAPEVAPSVAPPVA